MAEKLEISKNGYAKLERGAVKINVEHIKKILSSFDIEITELFKERDFNVQLIGVNSHHSHQIVNGNNNHQITSSDKEVEKLALIIAHKDELLALKDKEIELLRQLLADKSKS